MQLKRTAAMITAASAALVGLSVGTAATAQASSWCDGSILSGQSVGFGYTVYPCVTYDGGNIYTVTTRWQGGTTDVRAFLLLGNTCDGYNWPQQTPAPGAHVYPGTTMVYAKWSNEGDVTSSCQLEIHATLTEGSTGTVNSADWTY